MSGICGVLTPDGRAVETREIAALIEPLQQRGPDGSAVEVDGSVGLGHTALITTPEAAAETLPLRHSETGCIITADARLDYRDELIERLGISQRAIGDGELILRSYLQWGRACLDHIQGDFAFAIWDPREKALFCARDRIGMRSLIWHHKPGSLFAFATEAQTLTRHPLVPVNIDEGRVGDFFEDLEAHDLTSTFFTDVQKLPPAHAMMVSANGIEQWQYWRAEPQEPLRLADDREYAEAFLEVFSKAVASRLRSNGPVGSMLSGGMDSSSVTAVAAMLLSEAGEAPLKTFSAISDDPQCAESNAIRAALQITRIDPSFATLEDMDEVRAEIDSLTRHAGEPFDIHMALPRAVYLAGRQAGVKVMLDGVGGDTTLGSEPMVAWYLHKGQLLSAWREAKGEKHFWGEDSDTWSEQARNVVRAMAPKGWLARRQARHAKHKLYQAAKHSPLNAAFAARIDMAQRRRDNASRLAIPRDYQSRRLQRVFHPYVTVARERYDRTAAALAIEPRDPFLDLRVIEFCLSLPEEQLQKNGWPKVILRRATRGVLPEKVRWRTGKPHLGSKFTKAALGQTAMEFEIEWNHHLARVLGKKRLHELRTKHHSGEDWEQRVEAAYFSYWLSQVSGG